jgi:hypothetical protein
MSLVDQHGEWEGRKISIIGADLTKVSLPSVFLSPFSSLELAGYRTLQHVDLLLKANEEFDPIKRFLHVLRYFLSITQKEKFEKKPYNPILGEHHIVYVEPENSKGPVVFLAEQVCHHPPVFAYMIESKNEKIKLRSSIHFATKFHGNSISAFVTGGCKIELGFHGEQYIFNKPLPDLWIKNTIIGTKREPYDGEVIITCPKTNLKCSIHYKEEGWSSVNHAYVVISKMDNNTPIVTIKGVPGDSYHFQDNTTVGEDKVLLDMKSLKENKMIYMPEEEWDDRSSLKIWKDTSLCIAVDDITNADIHKRKVEDAQRKRRAEGTNFVPQYFKYDDYNSCWDCTIDSILPLISRKKDPLVSSLQTQVNEEDKLVQKMSNVDLKDKETAIKDKETAVKDKESAKARPASPKVSKK